ncbi:MbnP family protein [Reichenbachiella sp.]|uniref:MbnP family protein n=1 Tax=Reichenbachiella sp. TaxID=2184521 RepID=UPI003B5AEFED
MKHFPILSKISTVIGLWLVLSACSSDESGGSGSLVFNFTVKADDETLTFGSKKYVTRNQQQVTFERIEFYLSNIQLKNANSNIVYTEPDSYHLVSFDADHLSATITVEGVPSDIEIAELNMAIGVDAEANTSIDHVGDLDPTNGMAWDWNTGYKFFLMEGRYFDEEDPLGEEIKMHIGTDKNYFVMSQLFSEPFSIVEDFTLVYSVDAMAPFGTLDLDEGTVFMNDERGDQVADNYKNALLLLEETFGFVK